MDEFDIAIATEGEQLELIAADFSSEARSLGLVVTAETRPADGIRAGLEWVVPTAVALFVANKYLGTLLQEAAKDHYPRLKAALLKLVRRTTGRTREGHCSYHWRRRFSRTTSRFGTQLRERWGIFKVRAADGNPVEF